MYGRPPPCKGFRDGVKSLAVMYPASVAVGDRRPRWNPRIGNPIQSDGLAARDGRRVFADPGPTGHAIWFTPASDAAQLWLGTTMRPRGLVLSVYMLPAWSGAPKRCGRSYSPRLPQQH